MRFRVQRLLLVVAVLTLAGCDTFEGNCEELWRDEGCLDEATVREACGDTGSSARPDCPDITPTDTTPSDATDT